VEQRLLFVAFVLVLLAQAQDLPEDLHIEALSGFCEDFLLALEAKMRRSSAEIRAAEDASMGWRPSWARFFKRPQSAITADRLARDIRPGQSAALNPAGPRLAAAAQTPGQSRSCGRRCGSGLRAGVGDQAHAPAWTTAALLASLHVAHQMMLLGLPTDVIRWPARLQRLLWADHWVDWIASVAKNANFSASSNTPAPSYRNRRTAPAQWQGA
jgi:hypothetical protein